MTTTTVKVTYYLEQKTPSGIRRVAFSFMVTGSGDDQKAIALAEARELELKRKRENRIHDPRRTR